MGWVLMSERDVRRIEVNADNPSVFLRRRRCVLIVSRVCGSGTNWSS
jgi:hypothetical protein